MERNYDQKGQIIRNDHGRSVTNCSCRQTISSFLTQKASLGTRKEIMRFLEELSIFLDQIRKLEKGKLVISKVTECSKEYSNMEKNMDCIKSQIFKPH